MSGAPLVRVITVRVRVKVRVRVRVRARVRVRVTCSEAGDDDAPLHERGDGRGQQARFRVAVAQPTVPAQSPRVEVSRVGERQRVVRACRHARHMHAAQRRYQCRQAQARLVRVRVRVRGRVRVRVRVGVGARVRVRVHYG